MQAANLLDIAVRLYVIIPNLHFLPTHSEPEDQSKTIQY